MSSSSRFSSPNPPVVAESRKCTIPRWAIRAAACTMTVPLLVGALLLFSPQLTHKALANTEGLEKTSDSPAYHYLVRTLGESTAAAIALQWDDSIDPPPTSPTTTPYIPLLIQQPNCSLTRVVTDGSFNLLSQYSYPDYQDFLHLALGLSTTSDKWPNGCAQTTTGLASQQLQTVSTQSNGTIVLASINIAGNFPADNGQNVVVATIGTTTAQPMTQVTYPVVSSSYLTSALTVADVNGDGIKDLIVGSLLNSGTGSAGEISVLLGNSDGTFQAAKTFSSNVYPSNVTIDDLNGDGKMDLVVSGISTPGLCIFLGNGDGTFGSEMDGPAGTGGLAAVTADFNGDGKKDVALSSGQILLGNGNGTLTLLPGTLSSVAPVTGILPPGSGIASADFNNDGKIDLAVANQNSDTVDIYLGNGDGTFTFKSSFASLSGLQGIRAIDMDGDGNVDLFVGSQSGGVFLSGANTTGLFESALGNGDGTFHTAGDAYLPNSTALEFSTVFDVADFNGDGKPDIVSLDVNAANTSAVLRVREGLGNGKFADLASTTVNATSLVTPAPNICPTCASANTVGLVAADFNGDSKQDVVFATTPYASVGSTISVFLGNGNGTFAPQTDYSIANNVTALAVANLVTGGEPDIVFLANPSTTGTTQTVIEAMLNNGSGTFGTPQQIDAQPNLTALALADVNGDGKLDLVVSTSNLLSSAAGNVLVYLGNGDGTFQRPTTLSVGSYPGALALADMNNDGHPDIVVYTADSSNHPYLDILLGNGNGTFQTATSFQLPQTGVSSLAVNELSGGTQPLVLTGASFYPMAALGSGSGTISAAGELPTGVQSAGVRLVDVNGDGIPDILLTSAGGVSNQYAIEVFLSAASASSTYPTSTSLTTSTNSVTTGQPVTFTVQVTSPEGNSPPGGSVTFLDGSTTLATESLNSNGVATYTTSSLAAGVHSITASYQGNSTFATSTSSAVTVTVSAPALVNTTTSLTATPNSITSGSTVMFSATVAPASGTVTPAGTVTFFDGSTQLGTGTLNSSGVAALSTSSLPVGTQAITAAYEGSSSFAASTSSVVNVIVSAAVAPSFTLSGTAVSIAPGATTGNTSTVSVTPSGGFTGSVALTAALATSPTGATNLPTFSFGATTPVNITGASAGTGTLTISTTAITTSTLIRPPPLNSSGFGWPAAGSAAIACVLLIGIRARRRRWFGMLGMFVLLVFLAGAIASCGGGGGGGGGGNTGNPGTTAGSYTITVTGTSGSITQTATVNLTVN